MDQTKPIINTNKTPNFHLSTSLSCFFTQTQSTIISSLFSISSFKFFMRGINIATCYSDHAVKVSDSYCSGSSHNTPAIFPKSPSPNSPVSVSSIYRANLSAHKSPLLIHLHWTSIEMGFGFTIKIDLISHRILTGKGLKSFRSPDGSVISVFWDLTEARFDLGPEPSSGFYVVVMVGSEIGLLIGDEREKLLRFGILRWKFDALLVKFSLVSRIEEYSGEDSVFLSKARFCDGGGVHEILIKCGGAGGGGGDVRNQRLVVFVDGKQVFEVKRLRWNFRGNQTIFIDGSVVDMMWDVYEWLFRPESTAATTAAFMFRTRSGLDSRLWLEEKTKQETDGFSLLIRVCNYPD